MNKKYFIAIVPPEPVLGKIEAVKQEIHEKWKLKGALRSPGHITLHRPFEWKEDKEAGLIATLEEFSFSRNFSIELKNFYHFQPRVIFIDVMKSEDLNDLYLKLRGFARRNLNLTNEDEDLRGFYPHVTVTFRDLKKQKFYELWDEVFNSRQFYEKFDFRGFCLLRLDTRWEVIHHFDI